MTSSQNSLGHRFTQLEAAAAETGRFLELFKRALNIKTDFADEVEAHQYWENLCDKYGLETE